MKVDEKAILYMVAKKFGLKRDSFEERLKLQKIIYLLQDSGMQLGYGFGWYKYGPYSQDLVSDAYAVLGSRKSEYERAATEERWGFNDETKGKFRDFKRICGAYLKAPEKAELLASVRFVRNMWCPDVDKTAFTEEFLRRKPRLWNKTAERTDIEKAFDVCAELSG